MAEFVRDREALSDFRLRRDNLDPVIDESSAETSKRLDLDHREANQATDRADRDGWLDDRLVPQNSTGHLACMRRMSLLGPPGSAGNGEEFRRTRVVV
jgi:hypothetical protein